MFRKSPLASAVSIALISSSAGISPQILAQEVAEEADDDTIDEVITTGSRIRKDAFSSNSPIDVILTETAQLKGVADIAEMLQTTTIAAGSPQVTAATSTAFVQGGGPGAATLSLRGLGATRTLSLLNGRRAGPSGVRGGVSSFDLNVIPLAAIERVEILKDGASSIYGSDAVAGVVNYITKKGDGMSLDAYTSQTAESGGEVNRISASFGKTFSRGNFRITGDYYKNDELENGDRDFLACGEDYLFDPNTGERSDRMDSRTGEPWCGDTLWGQVWIYDVGGGGLPENSFGADGLAQFDYNSDLGTWLDENPFETGDIYGFQAPPGWYMVGYDPLSDGLADASHPAERGASFVPEVERSTFYGEFEFDVSDSVTLYGEALLNRRETQIDGFRQFWGFIYNSEDGNGGAFLGRQPSSVGWTGENVLSPTPVTDHASQFIQIDYSRYLAGIRGDFGNSSWNWDVNYQYSKSDGDYHADIIWEDSVFSNDLIEGSCVGTVTPVRGVPCLDIPWLDPAFLAGEISPELREFLFATDKGNTEYTQSTIEAFVSGDLFELPAGTVQAAFGVHYRDDEINDLPGEASQGGNSFERSSALITAGKDSTRAVFAEFDIPILEGKKGFQELSLNASARYTDVDSYGSDSTYKVGLNWQVTDTVRLRANRGTSFRTPALFELFLGDETGSYRQSDVDPCIRWGNALDAGNISQTTADNCAAETPVEYPDGIPDDFTGGNISATSISRGGFGLLEAETSDSTTIGLVWTPEFADFSVAIDHFDIQVDNQVDQLGPSLVRGCYASEFFPDDPLCDLFEREDLGSYINNILDSFINVATQKNSGWDLTAHYSAELGDGTLILTTQHTWQREAKTALFEGFERDTNGWFNDPKWVGNFDATYLKGDWMFYWGMDVVGKVSSQSIIGTDMVTSRGVESRAVLKSDAVQYHDFSVTKAFDNGITIVAGASNAFDQAPPKVTTLGLGVVGLTQGTTDVSASQYDVFGRRYFINLRYEIE